MAICPVHGHYEGTCKKCVPSDLQAQSSSPVIEDCDKFILRSFENECLTLQIEFQNVQQKLQGSVQAFNRHAHVVMEKLGIEPKEWILDAKNMVFVKRAVNDEPST